MCMCLCVCVCVCVCVCHVAIELGLSHTEALRILRVVKAQTKVSPEVTGTHTQYTITTHTLRMY